MKFSNAAQLKAAVKKLATDSKISAQSVLQKYVMERFLYRLSISEYRDKFILKGGYLTSSLVGISKRTTMDIDATATGFTVETTSLEKAAQIICATNHEDGFSFHYNRIEFIRENDIYPGYRVYLQASYGTLSIPFYMDVTTGDAVTPGPVKQVFWSMFDEGDYELLAYNLETLLAEKIETILSRGILNTRPRDFYDVDLLWTKNKRTISAKNLNTAIQKTMQHRNTENLFRESTSIVNSIKTDQEMKNRWENYQKEYNFAAHRSFNEVCSSVLEVIDFISLKK